MQRDDNRSKSGEVNTRVGKGIRVKREEQAMRAVAMEIKFSFLACGQEDRIIDFREVPHVHPSKPTLCTFVCPFLGTHVAAPYFISILDFY
jgi:hypothetical protein